MIRTSLAVALLLGAAATAADDLSILPAQADGVASKQMMHAYLMGRMREALDRRLAEYEKLKTPDDVAAWQKARRDFFYEALGDLPERTPLNAKVVARQQRDGYHVEKVLFESQPRHVVSALLYLPDAPGPHPGVLVPCGHSGNGKAYDGYQRISILLARNGLAAFCYDPIDQGERYQLLDANGKPTVGGTTAHCMVGLGSTLLGRNTATYRVWDGMRALDYLQHRKEIDPKRIGCTGNSGGGTLTSYLMALDDRIGCAAPSCYLTSLRRLCETIAPQDAEQNLCGQIAFGLDHADYAIIRAPKPTLISAATRDFFDIAGTWDTFRQAKRCYERLGFAERMDLVETDAKHGFHKPLREATVRWMRRWLLGIDDAITEGELDVAKEADILCTPRGQVMLLDGARSTYDLNAELDEKLAARRKQLWAGPDRAAALAEVRRITGIRRLAELPKFASREAGTVEGRSCRVVKLILQPEEGISLPALAFLPAKPSGEATLYLHDEGKHVDAAAGGPMEKLATKGHVVLAVDLRGLGETAGAKPGRGGISHYVGGDWQDLYLAYLLGRSYLAMRAEDILSCARFLAAYEAGEKPHRVHLVSIGRPGPAALHAAALEPGLFASVSLTGCLASWSDVVRTPTAAGLFENAVHGALRAYDLSDLRSALPKAALRWQAPIDPLGRPVGK